MDSENQTYLLTILIAVNKDICYTHLKLMFDKKTLITIICGLYISCLPTPLKFKNIGTSTYNLLFLGLQFYEIRLYEYMYPSEETFTCTL